MTQQYPLSIPTSGRGLHMITSKLQDLVAVSEIELGLCHIFIQHTSASLILCENADPDVQTDLEAFVQRLVPDGDQLFQHTLEGPDDMPAHIRSVLTASSLSIPIAAGRLLLGTWQGVYLWEHRLAAQTRTVIITLS